MKFRVTKEIKLKIKLYKDIEICIMNFFVYKFLHFTRIVIFPVTREIGLKIELYKDTEKSVKKFLYNKLCRFTRIANFPATREIKSEDPPEVNSYGHDGTGPDLAYRFALVRGLEFHVGRNLCVR